MARIQRILMVYPEVPRDTYWSFAYTLPFIHKKSSMPPLGLVTVAAYIPDSIELKLVDLNFMKLKEKDVEWADAVFISAMIVQKKSFHEVVEVCNRLKKTVVAGGPYATGSHEQISGVDHFILGEAEEILPGFLEDLENGTAKPVYTCESRPNLAEARVPRFDLLPMKSYASMAIQYSRGCPFHCEFCDIWKVYGNRPRLKPVEQVLRELDSLYKNGWRGALFIVDDNFIGNKGKVKKQLLPALTQWQKENGYPFRFFTEASINLAADEELLEGMQEAAFQEVFIGIETPSAEGLAETGKVQNLKIDLKEAVAKIQTYGIEVMAGFIMGFDSDTEDTADRQIQFIQETGIARAMVGLLTALPGTDLHQRLGSEGRLLNDTDGNNVSTAAANFKTKMPAETLRRGYCKVLGTIYDPNLKNYFARCNKVLDNQRRSPVPQREVRLAEILIMLRSLARQPFTPYGLQYVKFITRNLMKNFPQFAEAVKFSVIGHHLHQITRQMVALEAETA